MKPARELLAETQAPACPGSPRCNCYKQLLIANQEIQDAKKFLMAAAGITDPDGIEPGFVAVVQQVGALLYDARQKLRLESTHEPEQKQLT